MKRPLLRVVLLYVGGLLAADVLGIWPFALLAITLAAAITATVWARGRCVLIPPLIFLAGWTNATLHSAVLAPHDLRRILGNQPALVTVRGVLRETPTLRVFEHDEQSSWRTLARLDVKGIALDKQSWQPAFGCIAVTTPAPLTNLFAGQRVEVAGVAALPRAAVAEGLFDYRAYLKQQGIYYHLQATTADDWRIVAAPRDPPLADRFRTWARQVLARGLPAEDESLRLEWALTLGWKPALTEEVSEPFVRAATYHIFAVDGLRMAIIFGIFFTLFKALSFPRALCGMVLLPLIWFYVALTGWPASAIRATVMLTVLIAGWALKRPNDLLNSLFAAALIILVWEPRQLFQAGFQLSFLVVLCLILLLPPLYQVIERLTAADPLLPASLRKHWPRFVLAPARYGGDLLLTSFAAWIGSIPLVAYYFHIVTPVSTPANLVAVPLCGLVLMANFASLLLASWWSTAAELFNHAGWLLMECIRVSSHWFAAWPKAYFYVPAPSLFTSSLYYGLLLAIITGWLSKPTLRLWKCVGFTVAILVWGLTCWHQRSIARLTILPLNGGMAVYCDAHGNKDDLLVDAGTTNAVQFSTKPFLRAQGVNRLPIFLLTHGDIRHIGGAETLVVIFPVGRICASPLRFRSAAYRKALAHFEQSAGLVRTISRNDQVGGWAVLHPDRSDRFSKADDGAVALRQEFDGTRVLLLPDLGRAGQDALLERTPDLRADIVVAGLPSSSEALCGPLLEAIQPRVIIVADSEFPASERASPLLRQRLAQLNVSIIYTRFAGAVTIELSGRSWQIRTMSGTKLTNRDTGSTIESGQLPKSSAPSLAAERPTLSPATVVDSR